MPIFNPCPVCGITLKSGSVHMDNVYFDCPGCGIFGLTASAEAVLPDLLRGSGRKAAVLSYAIRTTPRHGIDTIVFDESACKRLIETGYLPTPQEQAENLIRWLGERLFGPGQMLRITFDEVGPVIGAQTEEGFSFVVSGLSASRLLTGDVSFKDYNVTLSLEGWERFEQLRRGTPVGRKAFMAMQYGDPVLDQLVATHFRPAVAETGFVLRRLDDDQPAGLIDDRLRVEIQSARFLIVDLTHKNAGAYWEAGYAEGLGKPVIYTCAQAKFEEASHFDTNHHLHVLWNENDMEPAVKKLKATIRATIPEARRE